MNQNSVLLLWSQSQMFDRIIRLLEDSRIEVLAFLNAYTLTITTDDEKLQMPKRNARKRGARLRYITEITRDNLSYCKRQLDLVDELRHLNKIRGNFLMNESELIASDEISPQHPITEGFYSNAKKIVKLQGFVFETLWDNAIPAEERIKQLEASDEINTKSSYVAEVKKQEGKEKGSSRVIDRFYICPQCRSTFIYADESQEHQDATGHERATEFRFFD